MWALGIIFVCMTLRQCPWIQARPSDRSFCLFASTNDSVLSADHTFSPREFLSPIHSDVERGPESLLQLLPQPARKIIGKLLDLNPESRATIEDLRSDEWYSGILGCQREGSMDDSGYDHFRLGTSAFERTKRLGFGYEMLFMSYKEQQEPLRYSS